MENSIQKYCKQYIVKSYEVDCHGFLRLLSLMNFLQDIATENADFLGLGLDACRQQNLAWVGSNYDVRIDRLPRLDEKFTITTWPAEAKLWGAIRDFVITDEQGVEIVRASSQWVLIDFNRRRPVPLSKHFPAYRCISERVIQTDFPKFEVEVDDAETYEYNVRFDDIDVNEHVNNAVYPLWASESIDPEKRIAYAPAALDICFKKEALYGEKVVVQTGWHNDCSHHRMIDKKSGDELAVCRIWWRRST